MFTQNYNIINVFNPQGLPRWKEQLAGPPDVPDGLPRDRKWADLPTGRVWNDGNANVTECFAQEKNQAIHKHYVNHRCVRRTTTWTWAQPVWITSPHRLPIVTWRVKWRIWKVMQAWKMRRKVSIAKRKKWKSFSWAQWAGNTELLCIICITKFQLSGLAVFLQPAMPVTILRPANVGILC